MSNQHSPAEEKIKIRLYVVCNKLSYNHSPRTKCKHIQDGHAGINMQGKRLLLALLTLATLSKSIWHRLPMDTVIPLGLQKITQLILR